MFKIMLLSGLIVFPSIGFSASSPLPSAPGGIYVGYYHEDASTNPEDPTTGSLYLKLPEGHDTFSGNMDFTYVGCQKRNIGTVSGNKNGLNLIGSWTGTVDGIAQSGSYKGQFNPQLQSYSGTYTNHKGKQFRDLRPCIVYTIAPKGTWELFPVHSTQSQNKNAKALQVNASTISWFAPSNTSFALLSIFDLEQIAALNHNQSHSSAILWQKILIRHKMSHPMPIKLAPNHQYIISVITSKDGKKPNYSSNTVFSYKP